MIFQIIKTTISYYKPSVVKNYYGHPAFKGNKGEIDLQKFYNLFTEANQSSYIDYFLDQEVMSFDFILGLLQCLKTTVIRLASDNTAWKQIVTHGYCWFNNDEANKNVYG